MGVFTCTESYKHDVINWSIRSKKIAMFTRSLVKLCVIKLVRRLSSTYVVLTFWMGIKCGTLCSVVLGNLHLWNHRFPLRDFCNHFESNKLQQNAQSWRWVAVLSILLYTIKTQVSEVLSLNYHFSGVYSRFNS